MVLGTGIVGVHVVDASTMPPIGPETRMVRTQLTGEKGSDVILGEPRWAKGLGRRRRSIANKF